MISQFAIDAINDLKKDGLDPSPEDIIRLNALALQCENGAHAAEFLALPRTAYLGKLLFREPTIGHAEWIDRVTSHCENTYSTLLAVNAYALSRQVDELPDPDDIRALRKKIDAFTKELRPFTICQVRTAVEYAINGCDPKAYEQPSSAEDGDDKAKMRDASDELVATSVHVGALYQTVSLGLGLSLADIRKMTPAAVYAVQEQAFARLGVDIAKHAQTRHLGEFYDTVTSIRMRLQKKGD